MSNNRVLNLKERLFAKRKRLPTPGRNVLLIALAVILLLYVGLSAFSRPASQQDYVMKKEDDVLELNFVGDVMMGGAFTEFTAQKGGKAIFKNVSDILRSSDATFANLESSVIHPGRYYKPLEKEQVTAELYATDYKTLAASVKSGISAYACANDHIFDYNEKSLNGLIEYFNEKGIVYSGISQSKDTLYENSIHEIGGKTVSFLSVADVYPQKAISFDNSERPVVLGTGYQEYMEQVLELAQVSDLTIVYMHWGKEGALTVSEEQQNLAHQLIDSGADIVIGCHPQVLQSAETYRGGLIVYSLGNFVYDRGYAHNNNSAILQVTMDQAGNLKARFVPIRINAGRPEVTKNPVFRSKIDRRLTEKLESYAHDELGCLCIEIDTEE